MRVSSLHIYPIKGVRGRELKSALVRPRGFAQDRRWLVTDENDKFLTQRTCAKLAQIDAAPTEAGLVLSIGDTSFEVARPASSDRRTVKIWNDEVAAVYVGGAAEKWLCGVLGRPVRLYFMDKEAARETSGNWGAPAPVSFADGYPFLVATTASLAALNTEIERHGADPVGMERFRPNIVIDSVDPWTEDQWKVMKIGEAKIVLTKPCVRCEVTTKDQKTGEVMGKEPLKTLAKIRRSAHPDLNGVLFGMNGFPLEMRAISVGDAVEIIEARPESWPLR
ncbi:MAG: MOSC domain-containing protein [Hyphococcus sp.]|nr:MAG: MOSC domain-containing protein [Marinicaulis sp.]